MCIQPQRSTDHYTYNRELEEYSIKRITDLCWTLVGASFPWGCPSRPSCCPWTPGGTFVSPTSPPVSCSFALSRGPHHPQCPPSRVTILLDNQHVVTLLYLVLNLSDVHPLRHPWQPWHLLHVPGRCLPAVVSQVFVRPVGVDQEVVHLKLPRHPGQHEGRVAATSPNVWVLI